MFLKVLEITPTSVLTFRKVPMSHKIIDSYNFVPPTTLSGFLYRLLKLSDNEELPKPKRFKSEKPEISEYYILETKEETKGIFSLGAYPVDLKSSVTFKSFRMGYQHLGKGHSLADGLEIFDPSYEDIIGLITTKIKEGQLEEGDLKKFKEEFGKSGKDRYYKRGVFKAILQGHKVPTFQAFKKEERRQPLDWYFCSAEKFYGFLISENPDLLDMFDNIENYGFKMGKEGFAHISKVYQTSELVETDGEFISSTIVPTTNTEVKLKEISEVESVYYFDLKTQRFVREMFALNGTLVEGGFYKAGLNGLEVNIPEITVKLLTGVI